MVATALGCVLALAMCAGAQADDTYTIPEVTIQAFSPKGLRASIPELSTEATTESGATKSAGFSTTEATTEAVTEACETVNGTEKCHLCSITVFGCCDDGDTAAHGPNKLGCCLFSAHGCCPNNLQPASGPDGEGCDCKNSTFGCCPDGRSYATGADNSGCGCEHTPHGCCPDRHTEANGPNFEGCSCHTFQFGCCPDGTTTAEGPNQQGCRCERSKHGCCGDGVAAATGPNQEGCDCASSKYGCCLDGVTEAQSKNLSGCAEAPINKQAACGLAYELGPCTNYSVQWFYDTYYGDCSRFHYSGCGGNGNRFADKAECEDVCVHPAGKDACRLPAVKASCTNNLSVRWYWDDSYQSCLQFHYGGCLGNANNYLSREECEQKCSPRLNPENTCTLGLDKGPCAGNFSRWGHNEETGRCEEFLWGGCEGNNNRFPSEAACILKCDPPGKQQLSAAVAGTAAGRRRELEDYGSASRSSPTPPKNCAPTLTRVRSGVACAGQTIFEEQFDSLRPELWQVQQYVPVDHPENPFMSYQRPAVSVQNGNLRIVPLLQQNQPGFSADSMMGTLDLYKGCTAEISSSCFVQANDGSGIIPPVVTGRITSKTGFAFTYGTVTVRAKLPQGDWMYPEILLEPLMKKFVFGSVNSGVVKVACSRGNKELSSGSTLYGNKVLYSGPVIDTTCHDTFLVKTNSNTFWGDNFHDYSVKWTPERLIFSVDGLEYGRVEPASNGLRGQLPASCSTVQQTGMAPFDDHFYITLGLAVGGHTDFPDSSRSKDNHEKPWKNKASKAALRFWNDLDAWHATWRQPELLVDYVKVVAL